MSLMAVLRSAAGWRKSGAESGEERLSGTKPKRNADTQPQTEARRECDAPQMQLVTSAGFAERNGRGREGEGADRQPVKRERSPRWSRRIFRVALIGVYLYPRCLCAL